MSKGCLLMVLGFALICRGFFTAAFWYADSGAEPLALWNGMRIFPGTFERVAGTVLLAAGMAALFRAR